MRGFAKVLLVVMGIGFGFVGGRLKERAATEETLDDTLALTWGSGKGGEGFYGMRAFVRPAGDSFSVRGEVRIGPGNGMRHDCGEIGKAKSRAEAAARFGTVTWRSDGVHVGSATHEEYFLARDVVEAHR